METAPPKNAGLFGLEVPTYDAKLVCVPVPVDMTTSYGQGTADGPAAIVAASHQLDLCDPADPHSAVPTANADGDLPVCMLPSSAELQSLNADGRMWAAELRDLLDPTRTEGPGDGADMGGGTGETSPSGETGAAAAGANPLAHFSLVQRAVKVAALRGRLNQTGKTITEWVARTTQEHLQAGRRVGIVGGDHSVPLGAIQVLAEHYPNMGMLHIDAHADLRNAYEGLAYSHASIMHNVLHSTTIGTLVQVGIRDFCREEAHAVAANPERIRTFFDRAVHERLLMGEAFATIGEDIVDALPNEVYVSFDIDGLDPALCPGTGTPVPGGLSFIQAAWLVRQVVKSGRKVIGFDLCEVAPRGKGLGNDEWDANVGARVLFELCLATLHSI